MDKSLFLVRRMKQGDEAAVDDFIRQYYSEIYKYCYYKLSDKYQAEDITQDTFISFFRHLEEYIHRGKLKNFLYVIAGNLCKNHFKKQKNVSDCQLGEMASNKNEDPEGVLLKMSLESEIFMLPEEFREVILLYYFQNLKIREIADILGIKISLVKYRLSESKKMLGKSIVKEDYYEYSARSSDPCL